MLTNFIFSLNCVLPIFIIILIGNFIKRKGLIKSDNVKVLNKLVFNLSLPVLLYKDVYTCDFFNIFDLKLISFSYIATILNFIIIWFFANKFIKSKKKVGAFVQGCYRGNFAIIGLSLLDLILGSNNTGKGAVITAFCIPLYNVLAVIVLTFTSEEKGEGQIKKAFKNIIKNPLIIALTLGIITSFTNIEFPAFFHKTLTSISQMATPLALIAIGATISKDMLSDIKLSVVGTAIKLIISPIILLTVAYFSGFRGEEFMVLFVLFSAPTAVSSFVMAENMKSDSELASSIILLTTLFSVFTFTFGIYFFKLINII